MKTKELTRIALMLSLLIVSAQIAIPIGPVAITLQTLIVLVIALVLTRKQAVLTMLLYLVMGLMGLPVFSHGLGGPQSVFLPSFGFVLSFIPAVWLMTTIREKIEWQNLSKNLLSVLLGNFLIYLIGVSYMSFILLVHLEKEMTLWKILSLGLFPFIPADVIKSILAVSIAKRLNSYLKSK
ncbi:MAG: biotin transporter BioY [Atopostipes sp.]|nr:biotin transporter BioY [Atopostipes sp.]